MADRSERARHFPLVFLRDLADVWSEEGRETMVKTAKTNPAVFFATCARLIPQDVKLTVEQSLPVNLSPADWADLRELLGAIRAALLDAANRPPRQGIPACAGSAAGLF